MGLVARSMPSPERRWGHSQAKTLLYGVRTKGMPSLYGVRTKEQCHGMA
jgi:hypothetical protein